MALDASRLFPMAFALCGLIFSPLAQGGCAADGTFFLAGFDSAPPSRPFADVLGLHTGEVSLWVRDGTGPIAVARLEPGSGYELEVPLLPAETMLMLKVQGRSHEGFVELAADLGSAGRLSRASPFQGAPTGLADYPALAVTLESTARHALLSDARPADDCQLARAQSALGSQRVREAQVLLRLLMEAGELSASAMNQGAATTLDVLRSAPIREAEWARLAIEAPARLQALSARLSLPFCSHFQNVVRVVPRGRDQLLNPAPGITELYEFETESTGRAVMLSASGFAFACAGGQAEFDFAEGFVSETWVNSPVPGEQQLVRRLDGLEAVAYRMADATADEPVLWRTAWYRTSYPDRPDIAERVSQAVDVRGALLNPSQMPSINPQNDPGRYALPLGPSAWFGFSPAVVDLGVGGQGTRVADGAPVVWLRDDAGPLILEVAGERTELDTIRMAAGVHDIFVKREASLDSTSVRMERAVRLDPGAGWVSADLPATLTLQAVRGHIDSADPMLALGESGLTQPEGSLSFGWVIEGDQRLVLRRCRSPAGALFEDPTHAQCSRYDRRELELLRREGDLWYVSEARQSFGHTNLGEHTMVSNERRLRVYRYEAGAP